MSKMEIAEGSRREEREAGMLFTQVKPTEKDKTIRMGVFDQFLHDLAFDFFSVFSYFPVRSRSLWWDAETLWHQGMFIAVLLPCEVECGAVSAVSM